MNKVFIFLIAVAAVAAAPNDSQRIVGGSTVAITQYPFVASLMYGHTANIFTQTCCAIIVNYAALVTVLSCLDSSDQPLRYQIRVGSAQANSGGTVLTVGRITVDTSDATVGNKMAILHTHSAMNFNTRIQPAPLAPSSYNLDDNQILWAAGYGQHLIGTASAGRLRHVQTWSHNQALCATRYTGLVTLTEDMMCAGLPDIGNVGPCGGDEGCPLVHNSIVVGLYSQSRECAHSWYPSIYIRMANHRDWIVLNS